MNRVKFQKFLNRDLRCWHCGSTGDDLVPHHRLNRGMGGSRLADRPANIIVMCSGFNQAMESDPNAQFNAQLNGWKLTTGVDPSFAPVLDVWDGNWYVLDDEFNRFRLMESKEWE